MRKLIYVVSSCDIPEFKHICNCEDSIKYWNWRARGFGGAPEDEFSSSCGEENLLCLPRDKYTGENILIHEFAHLIDFIGLRGTDPEFFNKLNQAYNHGEAKYYDVLERTLYNGLISGVSLDGGGFFYPNPLESIGQHQRQPWFGCACCPSNICRFIPSIPGYIYAVHNNDVYVNLFMANSSDLKVNGKNVTLKQSTSYPWNGDIKLEVSPKGKQNFAMKIRVPGWVQGSVIPGNLYSYTDKKTLGYTVKVNGKVVESNIEKGYFTIPRTWR